MAWRCTTTGVRYNITLPKRAVTWLRMESHSLVGLYPLTLLRELRMETGASDLL